MEQFYIAINYYRTVHYPKRVDFFEARTCAICISRMNVDTSLGALIKSVELLHRQLTCATRRGIIMWPQRYSAGFPSFTKVPAHIMRSRTLRRGEKVIPVHGTRFPECWLEKQRKSFAKASGHFGKHFFHKCVKSHIAFWLRSRCARALWLQLQEKDVIFVGAKLHSEGMIKIANFAHARMKCLSYLLKCFPAVRRVNPW